MMHCKFKDECPSYSGWCETPIEDFSRCIPFIINAVKTAQKETAAMRQQLDEKKKEIENWRNRLHDMININGKIADQLAQVIAERDVAIADLSHECSICGRDKDSPECVDCYSNADAWNTSEDHWTWRGLQKEAANNGGNDD